MFLQLSVILFTRGGALPDRDPMNRDPPPQRLSPPRLQGQRPPWTETLPLPQGQRPPGQRPHWTEILPWAVKSGCYASYWNAFLFLLFSLFIIGSITKFISLGNIFDWNFENIIIINGIKLKWGEQKKDEGYIHAQIWDEKHRVLCGVRRVPNFVPMMFECSV